MKNLQTTNGGALAMAGAADALGSIAQSVCGYLEERERTAQVREACALARHRTDRVLDAVVARSRDASGQVTALIGLLGQNTDPEAQNAIVAAIRAVCAAEGRAIEAIVGGTHKGSARLLATAYEEE